MVKGTEMKCWRRLNHEFGLAHGRSMVCKQTLRFTARLFTKTLNTARPQRAGSVVDLDHDTYNLTRS